MSKDLPLPGQLIQSFVDGKIHTVTHDGYVTIVENYMSKRYTTFLQLNLSESLSLHYSIHCRIT